MTDYELFGGERGASLTSALMVTALLSGVAAFSVRLMQDAMSGGFEWRKQANLRAVATYVSRDLDCSRTIADLPAACGTFKCVELASGEVGADALIPRDCEHGSLIGPVRVRAGCTACASGPDCAGGRRLLVQARSASHGQPEAWIDLYDPGKDRPPLGCK